MTKAYNKVLVEFTAAQIAAGDANNLPVGTQILDTTNSILYDASGGGAPVPAGGGGSFERAWAANTFYNVSEIVRATAASGAIGIGDRIIRSASGTSAATFAADAANWVELAEDPDTMLLAGVQTITGVKTFSALPELSANASTSNQPVRKSQYDTDLALKAPLASPALTGTPTAPTPTAGANTTQVPTAAWVQTEIANTVRGLQHKDPARAASTANINTNSTNNGAVMDGVTLATGDRILLKDQTTASQNGLYLVNASGGLTRTLDADGAPTGEVKSGMIVFIQEGTANGDMAFELTTDGTITIGTTALTFQQFTGAGQISATAPLTKTGNTLAINAATTSAAGSMSSADKTKLDGVATSAAAVGSTAGVALAASGAAGTAATAARSDHAHPLPANATTSVAGLMSSTDKTKLDGVATSAAAVATTGTPAMDGVAALGTAATSARSDHVHPTDTSRAPLASPALTGTPTVPTAAVDTNTTQAASTAFVMTQAASVAPVAPGTAAVGTSLRYARQDHVHPIGRTGGDTATAGTLVTATSVIATWGQVIPVDATSGNVTVTLPASTTADGGAFVRVLRRDTSANTVRVAAAGAETISGTGHTGAQELTLNVGGSVTFRCSGTQPELKDWSSPGAVSRIWLPSDASVQPVVWYSFRDLTRMTLNTLGVSAMTNRGTLAPTFNLTQTTPTGQPQVNSSTTPLYATFDGGDGLNAGTVESLMTGVTTATMGVCYTQTAQRASSLFGQAPATGGQINMHPKWTDANTYLDMPITSARINADVGTAFAGDANVYAAVGIRNGVNMNLHSRGNQAASITSASESGTSAGNAAFFLGTNASGVDGHLGRIYEFVFYRIALTNDERDRLAAYMLWGAGEQAQIHTSNPYRNIRPVVAL